MEEAANADHVVIINKGVIVAEGTPAQLKDKYSQDRLKIVPHDKQKMRDFLDSNKRFYQKIADQFVIPVEDSQEAIKIIDLIRDNILQFEMIQGTMDDVFIEVIGGDIHE
jgi:multidrug/hemolysin transport system ATP-binding protein